MKSGNKSKSLFVIYYEKGIYKIKNSHERRKSDEV